MKRIIQSLLLMSISLPVFSAEHQTLWTTGKIHVVLGVLVTILVLIFVFLFVLERKVSRLEKKIS